MDRLAGLSLADSVFRDVLGYTAPAPPRGAPLCCLYFWLSLSFYRTCNDSSRMGHRRRRLTWPTMCTCCGRSRIVAVALLHVRAVCMWKQRFQFFHRSRNGTLQALYPSHPPKVGRATGPLVPQSLWTGYKAVVSDIILASAIIFALVATCHEHLLERS